jgi:hypothetical protein
MAVSKALNKYIDICESEWNTVHFVDPILFNTILS